MKISTRLIIILTISVNAVMLVATFLILRQSQANMMAATRNEIRAHAVTLRIAMEEDYASGRIQDTQRLISRLSENTNIYGAILFNLQGQVIAVSNRLTAQEISYPAEVQQAISAVQPIEVNRQINNQDVFSIILPIRDGTQVLGAIEIAHPISFIRAELVQERRNIAFTAAIISAMILLVASIVLHFNLSRPVQSLLKGAVAIGNGDLSHRVSVTRSGGELTILADEFNRMARQLAKQREALTKETEEKLALAQRLRHSERLAVVGRLAAGIAHELGAPLQVIDGRAKQLLGRPDCPLEMHQRNLTIIRTQAKRITRIVRQILNLSRPYNRQLARVELAAIINEVMEAIELIAANNNVKIAIDCPADVAIEVDQELLIQALLNICINGIQEMPAGGDLKITCAVDNKAGSEIIRIVIADTGPGIPLENLDHIFEPFYTTKQVGQGTGLGLSIASRIIEEHSGSIEASNAPSGGAVFTIYLPLETTTDNL